MRHNIGHSNLQLECFSIISLFFVVSLLSGFMIDHRIRILSTKIQIKHNCLQQIQRLSFYCQLLSSKHGFVLFKSPSMSEYPNFYTDFYPDFVLKQINYKSSLLGKIIVPKCFFCCHRYIPKFYTIQFYLNCGVHGTGCTTNVQNQ